MTKSRNGNGVTPRDEMLAGRAARGDAAALALLFTRWQSPLVRFCRRFFPQDADARDLAQEALLRAARGLDGYDVARPFSPWIYRIARNACLNQIEKSRLRGPAVPSYDRPGGTPPPDVLVARREEVRRIRAALAALPEPDRALLTLKLVRGLGNEEIARRLSISPGALRTRASRALARLRAALDDRGKEARS